MLILIYIYLKKINALYKVLETDSGITLSYVDSPYEYQQINCIRITRKALEDIFLGENKVSVPENLETDSEKEREFLDYIVNNSKGRIKSIDSIAYISSYSGKIFLSDLVLVDDNGEEIILEYIDENENKTTEFFGYNMGYTVALEPENGVVTSIDVRAGT